MKTLLKLLVVAVVLSSCSTYRSVHDFNYKGCYTVNPMSTREQYELAQEYLKRVSSTKKTNVIIIEKSN